MNGHNDVPTLEADDRVNELRLRLARNGDLSSLLHETLDVAIGITRADMGNIQLVDAKGALRIEHSAAFPLHS